MQESQEARFGKRMMSPVIRSMFRKMAGEHGNKMLVRQLGLTEPSGAAPLARQWQCYEGRTARGVNRPVERMASDAKYLTSMIPM
jgi:hypothetical protein